MPNDELKLPGMSFAVAGCDPGFVVYLVNRKLPHQSPQWCTEESRGETESPCDACQQAPASKGFPPGPILIGRCAMTSLHSWNVATREASPSPPPFSVETGNSTVTFVLCSKKIQMPSHSTSLSNE